MTSGDMTSGDLAADDLAVTGAPRAPEPEEMEKLDRRVVAYWWLTGILSAVFLCAVLGVGAAVLGHYVEERADLARTVAWVVGGLLLFWAIISPPWAYSKWRFAANEELLRMRYGIFFHEERSIPVSRMQHIDLSRGPVERLFGLATLVVFTAGNEGSAFRVPGVAVKRAQELRDQVLAARGDDVL